MFEVKIIKDSTSWHNIRLITFELTYSLIIHNEILTHRVFSRNASSNRAILTDKIIASVKENPFVPDEFPLEKKGMSPDETVQEYEECKEIWLQGRDYAIETANKLKEKGVHKEIANRVLMPYQFITIVLSSTDWTNFETLRTEKTAQRQIRLLAEEMIRVKSENTSKFLEFGEWHLPYVSEEEQKLYNDEAPLLSAGRCGGVSYLNQNVYSPEKSIALGQRFVRDKHYSALEHPAYVVETKNYIRNFRGWSQLRTVFDSKVIP